MGIIRTNTIQVKSIEVGSRISFNPFDIDWGFSSMHVSGYQGVNASWRGYAPDELKDAEQNNFKKWFELPPARGTVALETMKVTEIGKPWKGKNKWNMKRIKEEWKAKGLI
jgi:hypothetical protein